MSRRGAAALSALLLATACEKPAADAPREASSPAPSGELLPATAELPPALSGAQRTQVLRQESQKRYLLGVVRYQHGDDASARELWREAARLDPDNSDARAGLEFLEKKAREKRAGK